MREAGLGAFAALPGLDVDDAVGVIDRRDKVAKGRRRAGASARSCAISEFSERTRGMGVCASAAQGIKVTMTISAPRHA